MQEACMEDMIAKSKANQNHEEFEWTNDYK